MGKQNKKLQVSNNGLDFLVIIPHPGAHQVLLIRIKHTREIPKILEFCALTRIKDKITEKCPSNTIN
jgi:hypothetical protein